MRAVADYPYGGFSLPSSTALASRSCSNATREGSAGMCGSLERARSATGRALRVDVKRIEGVASGHEQPIPSEAAKANIGAALGQRDEADWLAGRIEDLNAILLLVAHSPPAPKVAIDINTEAVRRAAGLRGNER